MFISHLVRLQVQQTENIQFPLHMRKKQTTLSGWIVNSAHLLSARLTIIWRLSQSATSKRLVAIANYSIMRRSICAPAARTAYTVLVRIRVAQVSQNERFYSIRINTVNMPHCNYGKFNLHLVKPEMKESSGEMWNTCSMRMVKKGRSHRYNARKNATKKIRRMKRNAILTAIFSVRN